MNPIGVAITPDGSKVYFTNGTIFAGTPGNSICHGQSVAALAAKFGDLTAAAQALGFSSVQAFQKAIWAFCRAS